jgi:hypothetical protein
MSSKSSAIGKGILIGAAAGAALYVMWRRSRVRHEVTEPPMAAREAAPPPMQEAHVAPAAAPEPEPAPAVEPEAVAEPEPERVDQPVEEPEPVVDERAPAAEAPPEPAFEGAAPQAPPPAPVAEDGARGQGASYTGRPRDLRPAGWPQPMPLSGAGGVRRPVPVSPRATWPGVAGAGQMRPAPFRRIPPRGGGGPRHRTG